MDKVPAKALYDYDGKDAQGITVDGALETQKNDELLEERSSSTTNGWIMVKDKHNNVGLVPVLYLEETSDTV